MAEPLHSPKVTSAQDNSRRRPDIGVIAGYLRELRRHDRGAQPESRRSASSGSAG